MCFVAGGTLRQGNAHLDPPLEPSIERIDGLLEEWGADRWRGGYWKVWCFMRFISRGVWGGGMCVRLHAH
jgi:hypothetical protein